MLVTEKQRDDLRSHFSKGMAALRNKRSGWNDLWSVIAEYNCPDRFNLHITPRDVSGRGVVNERILDNTAIISRRQLVAGIIDAVCNPSKKWFNLSIHGKKIIPFSEGYIWLQDTRDRILDVLGGSNFYGAIEEVIGDLSTFGSSSIIIYDDIDDVILSYVPTMGDFYLDNDGHGRTKIFYRRINMTTYQIVDRFGIENVSDKIKSMYDNPSQRSKEIIVCHAIEPMSNKWIDIELLKGKKFIEVYWVESGDKNQILEVKGYSESPVIPAKWNAARNEPYGIGPGIESIGDVKSLQFLHLKMAQAVEKNVNPSFIGFNVPTKDGRSPLYPGQYLSVNDQNAFVKTTMEHEISTTQIEKIIAGVQDRVRNAFFTPVFTPISDVVDKNSERKTATEINSLRAEQLIQLGPVIQRLLNEFMPLVLDRIFSIMQRKKMFAQIPADLEDHEEQKSTVIKFSFDTSLLQVQRANDAASIERLMQFMSGILGYSPNGLDIINIDNAIKNEAAALSVNTDLINAADVISQIREQRAKAAAEQQAQANQAQGADTALAQAKTAKQLADTSVSGNSALTHLASGGAGIGGIVQ